MATGARWTIPAALLTAAVLVQAQTGATGTTGATDATSSPAAAITPAAALPAPAATATTPVAGLQRDRRPDAAPRIAAARIDATGKARRLAGVLKPWPGNVEQIAEQGAWYSPLFHPGMPGAYDLRQWHAPRP